MDTDGFNAETQRTRRNAALKEETKSPEPPWPHPSLRSSALSASLRFFSTPPSVCIRLNRWFLSVALLLAAAGLIPSARAQSASNGFWQAQSIYQIITDRFFDGDPSNNNAEGNYSPTSTTGVHGGDFKGIEQRLDYIKALGATAIWISPVILNGHHQFHGYAGRDFYHLCESTVERFHGRSGP
jgi:hypothetical protein